MHTGSFAHMARAGWAVLGVELVLLDALVRLWPRALEPLRGADPLPWDVLLTYVGSVLFLGFFEGYRGFQRSFAPRVAARALYVAAHPSWPRVVLAPLFAMGLFGATRRRLLASWLLLVGIVGIIVAVHQLPLAYRAAIDGGVIVGLGWGALAIAASFFRALREGAAVDPEVGA